jgi:hypothetical protein
MVNMGGVEEGTGIIMEVDSIIAEVATKNIQVAPDTNETTIETVHPSTLSTITKTEKGTKNLQLGDGTKVVPMIK